MTESVKIVIVIEGGCVSAVLSAGVPVEYVTVDYDTDGASTDDVVAVPQPGLAGEAGVTADAFVHYPDVAEANGPFVLAAFNRFGSEA